MIRIVKLIIKEASIEAFENMFERAQPKISAFEGCQGVSLLQDMHNPEVFFTYSHWQSENDLNNYRQSALFETTWAETKTYFNGKPEAWSVNKKY